MEQGNVLRPKDLVSAFRLLHVSIPLEQGNVLRPLTDEDIQSIKAVSIPLEQGNVLRPKKATGLEGSTQRLNPFGTGQCLTTVVGS